VEETGKEESSNKTQDSPMYNGDTPVTAGIAPQNVEIEPENDGDGVEEDDRDSNSSGTASPISDDD
jgi:hypothetical protein